MPTEYIALLDTHPLEKVCLKLSKAQHVSGILEYDFGPI